MTLTRRHILSFMPAALIASPAYAARPMEIGWDDLIPPGVPYAEIIAEGDMDVVKDTWRPVYDANGVKLNQALDNAYIRMPGFIVPLELGAQGVTKFLLVPYVGACIHTPPPPANQLIYATSKKPWPSDALWDPVWVVGRMRTSLQDTDLGQTGYVLRIDLIEVYEW